MGDSTMLYGVIPGISDRVSRLVLGTVSFSAERQEAANALLDAFVAAGGTAIDTARSYGHGESERAVGSWLRASGRRDDVLVVTKAAHPSRDEPRRVTPAAIAADVAGSREALGIPTIDLLLLHRDDPSQPVGPIVDALNEQKAAGRVRGFGASNWTGERIDEANAYAAARGLAGFVASSPNLALAVPSEPMWPGCLSVANDAAALAWYRQRRFPLLAWSSQASGFFSGRFRPKEVTDENVARVYDRPDNWERLRRARQLAAERGCTPTQVALAWVLHQPIPTFALIGPRTPPELDDCLGALDVALSPAEVAWLNLEEDSPG
jgi:aryl-alcohol dehydrogenase-like predicted oxidoreductase